MIICYILNVCVLPKFTFWNVNTRGDGVRRHGLWEVIRSQGGTLMNGISTLIRETPERFLALSAT